MFWNILFQKKEEYNELNERKNWEKKEKQKREKRKRTKWKEKQKREKKKRRETEKGKKKEKRPVPPTRLLDEEFESETEEDCQEREAKGETHLFIIIFK